ncbi:TetR/AcrR family transcriptional regulator [Microbacterium sp.]|uniref:TetR/AcrR family transcriptional regulator n=1 Tax=Microbacterium sp. TaxID=51671 RepID=UPI0025CCB825|nr:TetR/AcrR family transcriptional regulator [Microbacterium sp.]
MSEAGPTTARNTVVAAALDLFAAQGFEATSVEQIAQAVGMSRSTFFRQFGGKDDVVFSDHDLLLAQLRAVLRDADATAAENPWATVCAASVGVFRHFAAEPELARRRYAVVRQVPTLREREIVTVFQYERLFDEYLRAALPGLDPIDAVAFSAALTAVHNHVLRRLLRGTEDIAESVLTDAYEVLLHRFGVHPDGERTRSDDVVVAVFPRRMPTAEVARRLRDSL